MLFGVGVSFCILYSIVNHFYVSCSGSITSVGGRENYLSAIVYLTVFMWFLFGWVSSSFWFLKWAVLFYRGTPWAFHITSLMNNKYRKGEITQPGQVPCCAWNQPFLKPWPLTQLNVSMYIFMHYLQFFSKTRIIEFVKQNLFVTYRQS